MVALDKTGTLTEGEPDVVEVVTCAGDGADARTPAEVVALAAGIERLSEHPLARAIVRYTQAQGIAPVGAADVQALTGSGATARVGSTRVYSGSPALFWSHLGVDLACVERDLERLRAEGKTVVVVGDERQPWGLIALQDRLRPTARRAIAALHAQGVSNVALLTGDNVRTARAIAAAVGIDDVYADLKPEEKVARVEALAVRHGHVAMVGDGVNDAPALAAATVGIAMGAAGSDVALETADVVLQSSNLERLAYALWLARRARTVIIQNLVLSVIVISVLGVGAVMGLFGLPVAVVAHEVSELVVIANGMRMLNASHAAYARRARRGRNEA